MTPANLSAFRPRFAVVVLLVGTLLIGLAQVASLPPWEGFDETAHYSYIQQFAETGTWPRFGDPVSADVDDYLKVAPGPATLAPIWSYRDFFASSQQVIEKGRAAAHADRDPARPWRVGGSVNWQAQHPPLYYALMAPAYAASKNLSLGAQFFLMRGVSYGIAWLGLCLAVFAMSDETGAPGVRGHTLLVGASLWPLLFPMWFPEMGRLGNDSLVILLAACAWIMLKKLIAADAGVRQYAALGIVLGLGLLTKATLLAFVVVVLGLLTFRAWQARTDVAKLRRRLHGSFIFCTALTAVAGWWYLQKFLETGSLIGSHDMAMLSRSTGLIEGLRQHANFYQIVRLPWALMISFLWSGTWSLVLPPLASLVPLAVTALLLVIGYVWYVRTNPLTTIDRVALLTLVVLLAGIFYQSLALIASGVGSGVAWYLHSFAPILAPLLGCAVAGIAARRGGRSIFFILLFYPLAFLPFVFGLQGLFFAGCITKRADLAYYDLASATACTRDLAAVYDNLAVLAFPAAASAFFAAGWVLMLIGVLATRNYLRSVGAVQIDRTSR
jgi:hypothetical protein